MAVHHYRGNPKVKMSWFETFFRISISNSKKPFLEEFVLGCYLFHCEFSLIFDVASVSSVSVIL